MKVSRFNENLVRLNVGEPEIGDWVICHEEIASDDSEDVNSFLDRNIGTLVKIKSSSSMFLDYPYYVLYYDIPENLIFSFNYISEYRDVRNFKKEEIKFWSKVKKDLEYIIDAKKYNL